MDLLHSWALEFFSGYAKAFDHADPEAIVAAYDIPVIFVTDAGSHVVGDRGALGSGMRGLLASYRDAGFHHASVCVQSVNDVSERLRSVDVQWQIIGQDEKLLWEFEVNYIFRLGDGGYRIAVVVNPAGH